MSWVKARFGGTVVTARDLDVGDTAVVPGPSVGVLRDAPTIRTIAEIVYYRSSTGLASAPWDERGQVMCHFTDGTRHLWKGHAVVESNPTEAVAS